ncbi:MAG: hypothetical protein LRY35_06210 [Clostridiales bacterium]|nr:hypothetical protein [Clostridiales bacterium]
MNSIESATPQKPRRNFKLKSRKFEKYIPAFFILAASVSIITTVGIVLTLFNDALHFFRAVPLKDVFSTELAPLAAEPKFGFIPLITGTVLTSLIAMLVATPIGLTAAIYMSQFATDRVRKVVKPIIELLAGIPTIVYGFFATPLSHRS